MPIDVFGMEKYLSVGQRRTYSTLTLMVFLIVRIDVAQMDGWTVFFPTIADVFRIGYASEVHLNVIQLRTRGHPLILHRGRMNLVFGHVDRTLLFAGTSDDVSTGSFLNAIVDTELTLVHRRVLRIAVDDPNDLDVLVGGTLQV